MVFSVARGQVDCVTSAAFGKILNRAQLKKGWSWRGTSGGERIMSRGGAESDGGRQAGVGIADDVAAEWEVSRYI